MRAALVLDARASLWRNGVVERLESKSTPSRFISGAADIELEPISIWHFCWGGLFCSLNILFFIKNKYFFVLKLKENVLKFQNERYVLCSFFICTLFFFEKRNYNICILFLDYMYFVLF